jgi:AraC-like DNA-binding protein
VSGRINTVVSSLILHGLQKHLPEALADEAAVRSVLDSDEDAGAPLGPYRAILQHALELDGGEALLRAGGALRGLSHPLLFVLLNSDDPGVVIDKEARLAGFIHSRHRVVIVERLERGIVLDHVSERSAPEPTEDLAACGQHIVLLEEIGCRGLRCRLPASAEPRRWVYDDGVFQSPAPGGGYHRWHFEWSDFAASRKPMPGLDEVLLTQSGSQPLTESACVAERVARVVRRDLGRTWKLADALETSARSLQRSLAAEGERYSDVVDRVRNDEADRLLRDSALSLTEIGYVCGFADSAHFSRSFKKRFGVPPSARRA